MKTKLMALLLVAGGSLFAETHWSIGVGIGSPGYYAPAPVYAYGNPYANPGYVAYRPPMPGPGYLWVDGYYDGYGRWFNGYWAVPPYAGAYWVAPRVYGGRWSAGYWGGPRYYGAPAFRGGYREGFREREHGGWNRGFGRGHR
jgi:hypothetical protein